jgi:hypothetical protein
VPDSITEWEFTADAAGWINEAIAKFPRLPFSRAKCEQRGSGSQKRRDLTLIDKNQVLALTGEVKLPWQKDGGSPYIEKVVQDARRKAQRAQVRFFFTWNVNEFVLWETFPTKTPHKDRQYKSWDVTQVLKPGHLEVPGIQQQIKTWLAGFLTEYANIWRGTALLGTLLPDEKFINLLESALKIPILLTFAELEERYKDPRFKSELDQWMRQEQGWTIWNDPEGIRENLERAAKFSCYALVNKLVFHEALLKRYAGEMGKLSVPDHLDQGDALRLHLEGYFEEAKEVTGDYETVFGEEHRHIGNRIPFYADSVVPHWRNLINQIHDFDFSKLDYDVIGSIFERLISPEERRKYGQFYTRPEVVDLINSFCIRRGDEKVMDPACGGGTFLVRAYYRKHELAPARKHDELLSDLFGVDTSLFATHLTTINLATRNLVEAENYPQIARSDFFDVEARKPFMELPARIKVKGMGKMQHREVEIPTLDAVVGNPPYVRQEQIPKAGSTPPERGTKEYYQNLVRSEAQAHLSGRSDIHCYFWPHALTFLKEDGFLCLLTSSQWLDVEYGFRLQEWILRHFEVLAVFESIDEPWFVGARVLTAVTILRRQADEKARMNNLVRFVQLRRPIREILAHDGMTAGAVNAADNFRDEILSLPTNTVNERYRARLVRQGDLWHEGVRQGVMFNKHYHIGSNDPVVQDGDYFGGKWGIYLRAPELWFTLLEKYGSHFVALGDIAEVRFGVKTGKDFFFFPKDCSQECLQAYADPKDFKATYGVSRKAVESGKVKLVCCGEGRGEIRPIEAEYLEPEVHSLMEIKGFSVAPEDCSRLILLVNKPRADLKGSYVLDYIKWGERQEFHTGSTCAARATENRAWYDLAGHEKGSLFWPMAQQYKHAIPTNDHHLICNHNLFDIFPKKIDVSTLGGILNSTWVVLSKFLYGRPVGVEGNLKTEVVDVKMMLVPNPAKATEKSREGVAQAFERMKERQVLQFLPVRRLREMAYRQAGKEADLEKLSDKCELDMPDRRELDDAVLEMMGVRAAEQRQALIEELYGHLRQFFEWTRQKEEKAILNKMRAKRRQASPREIATEILKEIKESEPQLLRRYDPDFLDHAKPFDTFELPTGGTPKLLREMQGLIYENGVTFMKGKRSVKIVETKIPEQDPLILLLARSGVHGLVRVPHEKEECERVLAEYEDFSRRRETRLRELIEDRTADEEMQEKIYQALMPLILWER